MGGSYNPVHMAHIALADFICQTGGFHAIWLVLSPLNPLKAHPDELVGDSARLDMLRLACTASPRLEACDIELSMPRPSYTIATLRALSARYPQFRFRLVIGSDNWLIFDRWKESEAIIRDFGVTVYPRPGHDVETATFPAGVTLADTPRLDISSTFIRRSIARGLDMAAFLPPGVNDYIRTHGLYHTDTPTDNATGISLNLTDTATTPTTSNP